MLALSDLIQIKTHSLLAISGLLLIGTSPLRCSAQNLYPAPSSGAQTTVITLDDAIRRAQANEPTFAAAHANERIAALDRSIARTAFLPSAICHNQVLYTQPNGQRNQGGQDGSQPSPYFIANNAVHEYTSQTAVSETLGLQQVAGLKATTAAAARTEAEFELSRRGLVATVVALYYGVADTEQRATLLDEGLKEATDFTDLTLRREAAREVAHADVVKAQLQQQQRQRDLADARLLADKTRLELAVLLFPDPHTSYATEPFSAPRPLPERKEVEAMAANNNPELKSALASLHESDAAGLSAKTAYHAEFVHSMQSGIVQRYIDSVNFLEDCMM